ncbi:MAG: 3-dehydroquinate synthase [Bacteroidales bacterium]
MESNFYKTHNSLSDLDKYLALRPNSKKFILLDTNTYTHCLPVLIGEVEELYGAEILEVEEGEESKSLSIVENLCSSLIESSADRDSILISLGGGVITDLGGFLASVFKRGIQHISIPTTLLGMVDASIGGKTAVNVGEIKNQIGTFNHNSIVYYHKELLESLDKRQILNGIAEIIKIALVKDEILWQEIKKSNPNKDKRFSDEFLGKSILLKEEIVKKDPNEENERKILNFGHTIGHAIESITLSKGLDVLHGEAVASGIYYATKLSEQKLSLPKDKAKDIYDYLTEHYKIIDLKDYKDLLLNYLGADKKNINGEFRFVLLEDIGKPCIDFVITKEEILNL